MTITKPPQDPAPLRQYIGQLIYTALEGARLGYVTDPYLATNIATENIMIRLEQDQLVSPPDSDAKHVEGKRRK